MNKFKYHRHIELFQKKKPETLRTKGNFKPKILEKCVKFHSKFSEASPKQVLTGYRISK